MVSMRDRLVVADYIPERPSMIFPVKIAINRNAWAAARATHHRFANFLNEISSLISRML
jgi:hypothetical protein